MRFSLTLLLLSLFALVLRSQTTSGYVYGTDEDEALIGAYVWPSAAPDQGTQTDLEGYFELVLPPGNDSLTVTYLGYEKWTGKVATDSTLRIVLTPAVATVAEITVRAERRPARVFATEKLNRLDIYLNAAAKADVLLAINSLPAATNPDETANVSLRGSPAEATGIFLNGIPLYDAVRLDQPNGVGQFSVFNTAIIQQVDLYPSNPPLYLGQAASGAVSLQTTGQVREARRAVNLNLVGGGLQISQPLGKRTGVTAYANATTHALLKLGNPTALADIDGFGSLDVGSLWTHQLSQKSSVTLFHLYLKENYGFRLKSGRFAGLFNQEKQRHQTILNYEYQGDKSRWEWSHGFNWSEAHYDFGNILTDLNALDYHTNLRWHWQRKQWNGTLSAQHTQRTNTARGTYPLYAAAWEVADPAVAYAETQRIQGTEISGFAKRSFRRISLGTGLRLGYDWRRQQPLWAGQLSGHWKWNEHQQLTLATGRYYQQVFTRGNPDHNGLNTSYQVAADWQYTKKKWTLQLAAYHLQGRWGGRENPIWGGEANLRYRSYFYTGNLSFTRVKSTLSATDGTYPSNNDFGYLLRWQGQFRLPWELTLNSSLIWREGTYFTPLVGREWVDAVDAYAPIYATLTEGERQPDYFRWDVGLSRIFYVGPGALIAYFNTNNVLDTENIRDFHYDALFTQASPNYYSRRTWFLGCVWQW